MPSPNTFPAEELIALLKAGLWPNDAVEPNAGELPKAGGLPNTGALPNPPVKKQRLSVLSLNTAYFSAQAPGVNAAPACGSILGSHRLNTLPLQG